MDKADTLLMPYFISNKAQGCSGWATVKEDGEVIGCHTSKAAAIKQMVAVSLAEDMEPGGERNADGPKAVIVDIDDTLIHNGDPMDRVIDYVNALDGRKMIITGRREAQRDETVRQLRDAGVNYTALFMKDTDEATSTYKRKVAERLLARYNIVIAIDNDEDNRRAFSSLGIPTLNPSSIDAHNESDDMDSDHMRAVNQSAPAFMRAAARRGLEYYADGKGGDGLVDRTIREARLMADGQVSDDKWIRIAAWIARHLGDLDSPNANPSSDNYPSAGVVAHLLWGSGPSKRQAERALAYAERVVERIRADEQNNRWSGISINLNKDERTPVSKQVERRVSHVEFDVRELDTKGDKMTFRGYAAVFNSPSQPLPFTEYIREGAFRSSLKSRNEVKMFKNHNTDIVLGSTRAGTLRLTEDSTGLLAEADLPPTTDGKDLSILMQRGDVNSMSFGFSVPAKGDSWSADGQTRELHQIRLHEVSIVTGFPAYEATTASVRSIDFLATRTAVDADALADALTRLESGEELDGTHADLITEVVSKLRKDAPVDEAQAQADLLELKRKQLDLMAKVF